jgi:hypothetical protein
MAGFHYALIAFNITPLAKYFLVDTNFTDNVLNFLETLDPIQRSASSLIEDHLYAALIEEDHLSFVCDSSLNLPVLLCEEFLQTLRYK